MMRSLIFFLMIRRPPRSTRTDTLLPCTTLFRCPRAVLGGLRPGEGHHRDDGIPQSRTTEGRAPRQGRGGQDLRAEARDGGRLHRRAAPRSEEPTSELQSLMRTSYAVFCLKTTNTQQQQHTESN